MLEVDEPHLRAETAKRQRYLAPGLPLRISDLTDSLGGYAASVVEVDGQTIWIDPEADMVIVRLASHPKAANAASDATSLPAYRAVGDYLMAR